MPNWSIFVILLVLVYMLVMFLNCSCILLIFSRKHVVKYSARSSGVLCGGSEGFKLISC